MMQNNQGQDPKKKLNLKKENIKRLQIDPDDPKYMEKVMGEYYQIVGNCAINLVSIFSDMANSLREISIDTGDLSDNSTRMAKDAGVISEMEIEEREAEDNEPPANADT